MKDAHIYVPQEGQSAEGDATDKSARMCAERGYPQVVHRHAYGEPCNDRCHRIDPPT